MWASPSFGDLVDITWERQILRSGGVVTDYFPDLDDGPWLSDVATWRMAWLFAESRQSDPPEI
ncbi:MAG: hypothetical protein WBC36_15060 [Desulfobacterales bacterium]|nr:hypothetical protein [Desulfobacterales bacterium]